jgi:predicted nucleotidyltransferase
MGMNAKHNSLMEVDSTLAETGVIRTLLYFDIFHYPLTLEEIIKFHPLKNSQEDIVHAISFLRNKMVVFKFDNFYSLQPDHIFIQRRKAGNELAKKRLKTAKKYSWLISQFPFVKAIMLSGSLSKDYMEANSDIDYFIITEPGRLWLTRGFLALFKRLFLLNSHKFFCTNYLIDSQSLEIEEKNIYTAIETATLIPVYGRELYSEFINKNQWTKYHLPNLELQRTAFITEKVSGLRKIIEQFFSGKMGEKLDLLFMKLAIQRWKKKFGRSFNSADFELAFKSRRNVSKNHPRFFQKQILNHFHEKIEAFEVSNNIKLSA